MAKSMEWVVKARELRGAGLTYRAIGGQIDRSHTAVRLALNPDARERNLDYQQGWYKERRQERNICSRNYYAEHREEIAKHAHVYYENHRAQSRTARAEWRARLHGATVAGDRQAIASLYRRARSALHIRCYLCGHLIPKGRRHLDHIVPLSKGGAHVASNLACACRSCNARKGAKLPEEVGVLI